MLIWLDEAPLYSMEQGNQDEVCAFIDSIICCDTSPADDSPQMDPLLSRQKHLHTNTCKKRNRPSVHCRFGIPFYPMDRTRILEPLDDNTPSDALERLKENHQRVRDYLENRSQEQRQTVDDEPDTFDEMLSALQLSLDEYILAVRFPLKKSKVFLRRRPKDKNINPFSTKILELHRANMDIQYVSFQSLKMQYC